MMKFLTIVILAVVAVVVAAATDGEKFQIAKAGCSDRCGDVSIPFPFGTTEGCYLNNDDSFFVNCSQGEVAYWGNSEIEITNISLTGGHFTIMKSIARDCRDETGASVDYDNDNLELPRLFAVSSAANKFVAVGCDTNGAILGHLNDGRYYRTGCSSTCFGEDVGSTSCAGLGCCQTSITSNVLQLNITLGSFVNYIGSFDKCGYAFVVEQSSFTYSPEKITSLSKVERLPMVVDWVIGDGNCSQTNSSDHSYGCRSVNSVFYEPDNGSGYRCNCTQGYQGNPYLDHGCRDIDECKDAGLNMCSKLEYCVNTNGSFECVCPKGYYGDGRRNGNGCTLAEYSKPQESKPADSSPAFKLAAGICIAIIVLLLSACWLYFVLQNKRLIKMRQHYFHQNGGMLLQQKLHGRERDPDSAKIYTEYELKMATKNFHHSMIIGEGGYGNVYKGFLQADGDVAIKKAKQVPKHINQFANEVIVLSKIKHKNVVKLLGCCLETEVPLLVYEFVSNGTLAHHVHNKDKAHLLSWETRLRIAQDVASVLSYLHYGATSTPIIHRDVKCANILLDHSFTAKVADFGASRLVPLDPLKLLTKVQGTWGYLDPKYVRTNKLNEKSDVYSFGVVLVELLTGMTALNYNRPEDEINLANLFMMKQDCLYEILDENVVRDPWNEEEVRKVCTLARRCLRVRGEDRPSMKEVAMELERVRIGQHSWNRTDCVEEGKEFLLGEGFDGLMNDGGSSSSVGCDSLSDHMILHGGR